MTREPTAVTFRFAGRIALVSGAAGDIGWAIVRAFASAGATVLALDGDRAMLDERRASSADAIVPLVVDLTDDDAVAACVEDAQARFGGIDILVNNAAAPSVRATLDKLDRQAWDRTMAVNVDGAFSLTRHVLRGMRSRRSGVIITIASQLGHVAAPGSGAYSASKAALIALTRSIALDHAAEGIRAVSLSPGAVLTERIVKLFGSGGAATAALAPRHPLGRLGTADEIAFATLVLASDQAGFITGTDLVMDGGYTAQ